MKNVLEELRRRYEYYLNRLEQEEGNIEQYIQWMSKSEVAITDLNDKMNEIQQAIDILKQVPHS